MALFFRSSAIRHTRAAVREALAHEPLRGQQLDVTAEAMMDNLVAQDGGSIEMRPGAFLMAAVLLATLATLAWWAESREMATATEQLWTAFQTVLGVIVGFLGGEAAGVATAQTK